MKLLGKGHSISYKRYGYTEIVLRPPLGERYSELVNFAALDRGVVLGKLLLVLALIVEVAIMVLGVPVLGAEHVVTLARESQEAYLLPANPAKLLVGLF